MPGQAGESPGAGTPDDVTFRTATDLVALNVTVTSAAQKQITGLRADQFVVIEDGVRQPIAFFSAGIVPLDVAILVDASASMGGKIELARAAAGGLARSLRSGDRASVVEFRESVRIRQALTGDSSAVQAAIGAIVPSGSTSLYDALYIALKDLSKADRGPQQVRREAIVLLSDGEDTASLSSLEDVSDLARRTGVAVYTVFLKSPPSLALDAASRGAGRFEGEAEYGMKALAQDTGGRAFFPKAATELKAIYDGIAEELGHQYSLGYVPTNARRDGAWRRVAVQVLAGDARPRTRAGYFASVDTRRRADATAQP
jgi:Ca-activated chloride channel family protein